MGKKEKDKKEVILFFPQKEMSLKCLSHRQSTQNVVTVTMIECRSLHALPAPEKLET